MPSSSSAFSSPFVSLIFGWWIGRHPEPRANQVAKVINQVNSGETKQQAAPTPLTKQIVSLARKPSHPVRQNVNPVDNKETNLVSLAAPVPQRIQEAPLQTTSLIQTEQTIEQEKTNTSRANSKPTTDVPYLDELPEALQRDIPELTLSLHFFSPDPARRMLRVNGKIRHEKDTITSGLSIAEIRETATLLNYRGTLFLLPAPGQ